MNYKFKLSGIIAVFSIVFLSMEMNVKPKKVIVFGDSNTQAGVQNNGYINKIKKTIILFIILLK